MRGIPRKDITLTRENPHRVFSGPIAIGVLLILIRAGAARADEKNEIPSVNGSVGSCSALFTVLDAAKKPIYDAKVSVTIHYGFAGLHKVDLLVGTNGDGKARVIGLPEKSKKPLEFRIRSGELSKTVEVDPTEKCESAVEVVLDGK